MENLPEDCSRPCTRSQAGRFASQVKYQSLLAKRSASVQHCEGRSVTVSLNNVGLESKKSTLISSAFKGKVQRKLSRERAKISVVCKQASTVSSRDAESKTAAEYSKPCTRSQAERFTSQVKYQDLLAKRSVAVQQRCEGRSMQKSSKVADAKKTARTSATRAALKLGRATKVSGGPKQPSKASVIKSPRGNTAAVNPWMVYLQATNSLSPAPTRKRARRNVTQYLLVLGRLKKLQLTGVNEGDKN